MKESKKILIATASHLSSCPRLLKEADLLSKNGYLITIVYLKSINRISIQDLEIEKNNPNWNFISIKWDNSLIVIFSKFIYYFFKIFNIKSDYIQSTSFILIHIIKKLKADLYIAHHPSVLVAAAKAAYKYKSKFSYDVEDAFPFVEDGRFEDNPSKDILYIENKYINKASLISTASPLYIELYRKLYDLKIQPIELLNVFEINNTPLTEYKDRVDLSRVSLYWFSQTVGLNRGLQDLFTAVNDLDPNAFELHIRGNCSDFVKETLMSFITNKKIIPNIYFHDLISADELELRNKEHDIGFAIEVNSSLNKDMCISNKIFDYLRSGLMLVATNTRGHQIVINDLQNEAISYTPGDTNTLSNELKILFDNPECMKSAKQKSLQLAIDKYNWAMQSKVFISKVSNEIY